MGNCCQLDLSLQLTWYTKDLRSFFCASLCSSPPLESHASDFLEILNHFLNFLPFTMMSVITAWGFQVTNMWLSNYDHIYLMLNGTHNNGFYNMG